MLYQFAKMTGNDTTWEEIPEDRFSDVGDVSGWASEAVKWAVTHGLLNGAGGMLLPKNGATRAQVAQVFMNAENLLTKTTPITDPLELEVPPVVFTPGAMEKLNNYAVFASKMTPDQFKQVYDICVELVRPAAGLTKEQQLYYVAKAVNLEYQLTTYDDTTEHYGDPYGVLIEKRATCSGCTRTVGLCLNILGFSYEHVNEGEWTHQWARVKVGDIYWVVDGDGFGMCYKELAPYEHSDFIDMNQVVSPEMPTLKAAVRVSVGDYSFEKTVDVAAEGSPSWGSDGKEVSIHLPDELGNEISLDSWDTPIKLNIDVSEGVGPFVIGELQDRTILERSEEKTLHAECVIPEKWLQRVRDDGTLELSFVTYDVFGNNIFVTLLVKP